MRNSLPMAAVLSLLSIIPIPATAAKGFPETAPVEALEAALRAGRVAEAVDLLTDDAILRDIEGNEHSGKEAIRAALEGFMKDEWRADVGNRQVVEPGRVTWSASVSTAILKRLGVAPIEAAGEATTRQGKVSSYRLRLPASAAARYEKARAGAARDLVKSLLDLALVRGDEAGARALLAGGYADHDPFPGKTGDADGFLGGAAALRTAFPGLAASVEALFVDGAFVTARLSLKGVQSGEYLGRAGTGRAVDTGVVWLFRVDKGLVAERWGGAGWHSALDLSGPALAPPALAPPAPVSSTVQGDAGKKGKATPKKKKGWLGF
jgi:predicted ester cyclase/ketosteroid isomerase-like protein